MDRSYIKSMFLESMVTMLFGQMLANDDDYYGDEFLEEFISKGKNSLIEFVRANSNDVENSEAAIQDIEEVVSSLKSNIKRSYEASKKKKSGS